MSAKVCRRCGYVGGSSRNLRRHLERARPCEAVVEDVAREALLAETEAPQAQTRFACESCAKTYSRASSLKRHETTCVVKQVVKHIGSATSVTKPVSTDLVTEVKMSPVRSFMNENLDYLVRDVDRMEEILSLPGNVVINLISEIHFNQKRPENRNVYMNDDEDEHGFVVCDGRFVKRPFLHIADLLLVNVRHIINGFFDYIDDQDDVEFDEEIRVAVDRQVHNITHSYNTTYEACKIVVRECTRLSQRLGTRPVA